MIYTAQGVFKRVYLTNAEKALLSILDYFKDDKGKLSLSGDFSNLMMDDTFEKTITDLLNKVENNLSATSYIVKIE